MTLGGPRRAGQERRFRTLSRTVATGLARVGMGAAAIGTTAILAALCAAPAASASIGRPPRPAATATPHPGWVKYYVVQGPKNGHKEFLYEIAAKTLGHGGLAMVIFGMNKGRPQPDGGRLEDPGVIHPGWILVLPGQASGPGVHYGPLPRVTAAPAGRPTAPPGSSGPDHRRMTAPGGASAQSSRGALIAVIAGSAALIVLLIAGAALVVIDRRRGAAASREFDPAPGGLPLMAPPQAEGPAVSTPPAPGPPAEAVKNDPAGEEMAQDDTVPENTAQEYNVTLGDDQIRIVLAQALAASGEEGPGDAAGSPAPGRYLVWAPVPYDTPEGGTAFVCVGTGDEGCLSVDLAAAPGAVTIGGDRQAATRLAESMAHQLCAGPSAIRTCTAVIVGDALPRPHPAGATWVASLSRLGSSLRDSGTAVVFCELQSNQEALALAGYVSGARLRVVPIVVASDMRAPWSFTAQPSRRRSDALHPLTA